MRRLMIGVLMLVVVTTRLGEPVNAQDGIGTIAGPFASSFVDHAGVASDAVCNEVTRTPLADGSYYEEAHCRFLPGASLPASGKSSQDKVSSPLRFWSDYTYELTGELELAQTWRVTVSWKGDVIAESTYTAEPVTDRPAFPGWIASTIPNPDGAPILLSATGLKNQLYYGISDAAIVNAFNDGWEIEFEDEGVAYEGRWSGGVLVFWRADLKLANVLPAGQSYIDALIAK